MAMLNNQRVILHNASMFVPFKKPFSWENMTPPAMQDKKKVASKSCRLMGYTSSLEPRSNRNIRFLIWCILAWNKGSAYRHIYIYSIYIFYIYIYSIYIFYIYYIYSIYILYILYIDIYIYIFYIYIYVS